MSSHCRRQRRRQQRQPCRRRRPSSPRIVGFLWLAIILQFPNDSKSKRQDPSLHQPYNYYHQSLESMNNRLWREEYQTLGDRNTYFGPTSGGRHRSSSRSSYTTNLASSTPSKQQDLLRRSSVQDRSLSFPVTPSPAGPLHSQQPPQKIESSTPPPSTTTTGSVPPSSAPRLRKQQPQEPLVVKWLQKRGRITIDIGSVEAMGEGGDGGMVRSTTPRKLLSPSRQQGRNTMTTTTTTTTTSTLDKEIVTTNVPPPKITSHTRHPNHPITTTTTTDKKESLRVSLSVDPSSLLRLFRLGVQGLAVLYTAWIGTLRLVAPMIVARRALTWMGYALYELYHPPNSTTTTVPRRMTASLPYHRRHRPRLSAGPSSLSSSSSFPRRRLLFGSSHRRNNNDNSSSFVSSLLLTENNDHHLAILRSIGRIVLQGIVLLIVMSPMVQWILDISPCWMPDTICHWWDGMIWVSIMIGIHRGINYGMEQIPFFQSQKKTTLSTFAYPDHHHRNRYQQVWTGLFQWMRDPDQWLNIFASGSSSTTKYSPYSHFNSNDDNHNPWPDFGRAPPHENQQSIESSVPYVLDPVLFPSTWLPLRIVAVMAFIRFLHNARTSMVVETMIVGTVRVTGINNPTMLANLLRHVQLRFVIQWIIHAEWYRVLVQEQRIGLAAILQLMVLLEVWGLFQGVTNLMAATATTTTTALATKPHIVLLGLSALSTVGSGWMNFLWWYGEYKQQR